MSSRIPADKERKVRLAVRASPAMVLFEGPFLYFLEPLCTLLTDGSSPHTHFTCEDMRKSKEQFLATFVLEGAFMYDDNGWW